MICPVLIDFSLIAITTHLSPFSVHRRLCYTRASLERYLPWLTALPTPSNHHTLLERFDLSDHDCIVTVSTCTTQSFAMRHLCYCLCVLFFAFSLPCSARLHRLNRALVASPPDPILAPPSHDPFYQVPIDISSYEPGHVLRSRPISTSAFKTIYARSATQYFYRTTGNGDEADGTVVTVVSPVVPRASRSGSPDGVFSRHSILVVGTAEDSAALDCAPSYVYSSVDKSSNSALVNIFNRPVISAALFRGWYVVVPDGEGSKVSFIATRSGHRTLQG